jgi:5-methylcytosine-specific restriction protein B
LVEFNPTPDRPVRRETMRRPRAVSDACRGYLAAVASTTRDPTLQHAIAEFDARAYQAFEHEAEEQRKETLRRYPPEHWQEMILEEYAQGQEEQPENFCRWIERQTDQMGSIRGGSARKLIIYKHRNKPGWYYPANYGNERVAWNAVRDGFLRAFDLAEQGRWDEIEEIEPLTRGAALLAKVLWVYFPDDLLPITSSENLRHFLRGAGRDDIASDQSVRTIRLNKALLDTLRGHSELAHASTKTLERLLYRRISPFEGRLVKIAPGENARFWPECRSGNYICVGWDEVGDLRRYESKDAFLAAFREAFADYSTEAKLQEKANVVWLLLGLAVGERVVANKGTKEVLAVGTIESPGYTWNPDRETHRHTLRVRWDEGYATEIPPSRTGRSRRWCRSQAKSERWCSARSNPKRQARSSLYPGSRSTSRSLAGSRRRLSARIRRSFMGHPGQGRRGTRAALRGGGLRLATRSLQRAARRRARRREGKVGALGW